MADKSLNLGTIFTADASRFFAAVTGMKTALKTLNSTYTQTGKAAKESFAEAGLKMYPIMTMTEMLDILKSEEKISTETHDKVKEFMGKK